MENKQASKSDISVNHCITWTALLLKREGITTNQETTSFTPLGCLSKLGCYRWDDLNGQKQQRPLTEDAGTSWWLNQPIWKIYMSNPRFGVKMKNMNETTTQWNLPFHPHKKPIQKLGTFPLPILRDSFWRSTRRINSYKLGSCLDAIDTEPHCHFWIDCWVNQFPICV